MSIITDLSVRARGKTAIRRFAIDISFPDVFRDIAAITWSLWMSVLQHLDLISISVGVEILNNFISSQFGFWKEVKNFETKVN